MDDQNQDDIIVITREFKPSTDNPILYATWRNAIWFDEERDKSLASSTYSALTKEIKNILKQPETCVRIACDKKDSDFIVGYAVFNKLNLEFVYIKINFRNKGIAKLLTKGFQSVSEPMTKIGKSITESHSLCVKENHGTIKEDKGRTPVTTSMGTRGNPLSSC